MDNSEPAADKSTAQEKSHGSSWDQLRWVLEESGEFPDLPGFDQAADRISTLQGGVDAATYLVKCLDRDVVVKLNSVGLEAEARALRAWRLYTPRVPEVLGHGTVASTDERSIKYLIVTAMKNDAGQIVETAADYLDRSPESARELGQALGDELHRMHQAVDHTGFGNFADSPGSERTYRSWAAYLDDFLAHYTDFVEHMGIAKDRISAARAFIRACPFVTVGRFLHGDVTVRNVAVHSYQPITVGLFDPNPVSGDPSWDVAPMANNVAFNVLRDRREGEPPRNLRRDQELLAGFWESYPDKIAEESLLPAQLMQAVLQAEHRQSRFKENQTDAIEVEVAQEFIGTIMERMAA
jgi:aminoglycoside phosphotransferase (APT) family kinase protein